VGRAVRDSGLARADVFVTSKLQRNRGYDLAFADLRASLERAGLDYFDLYLLHSPIGGPHERAEGWRALVDAQRRGLARSVGVSNFGVLHLAEIVEMVRRAGEDGPGGAMPAVHQVDLHPFTRHEEIVDMCGMMGTLMEAWGPLARGTRFAHPAIARMAEKYGRTPAQIMLRWGIQHVGRVWAR
jgi:diketogulonate reductase-like aldo/keto reductase